MFSLPKQLFYNSVDNKLKYKKKKRVKQQKNTHSVFKILVYFCVYRLTITDFSISMYDTQRSFFLFRYIVKFPSIFSI